PLLFPPFAGPKPPRPAPAKSEKAPRMWPDDPPARAPRLGPFLYALTEKMPPKEKQALIKATDLRKGEIDLWQKLETRAKKLESALKSARIRKPSHVYQVVSKAAPDEILFLLYHSP